MSPRPGHWPSGSVRSATHESVTTHEGDRHDGQRPGQGVVTIEPGDLYRLEPGADMLTAATLVQAIPGFIDAGSAVNLAVSQLLDSLEHEVVVRFDHDVLIDYRSRRPRLTFNEDHYEDYVPPELVLYRMTDSDGVSFLLLAGPEPDFLWDRFTEAMLDLVTRFEVQRSVGLLGIPMAMPHTRPVTVTSHATRPGLVTGANLWRGKVAVPASLGALLEIRLGDAGLDGFGFAAHVPYYLAESDYPAASAALLEATAASTGLSLPLGDLIEAGTRVIAAADEQLAGNEEIARVVSTLERQFDALTTEGGDTGIAELSTLSAEDIGAQVERFLAQHDEDSAPPDS